MKITILTTTFGNNIGSGHAQDEKEHSVQRREATEELASRVNKEVKDHPPEKIEWHQSCSDRTTTLTAILTFSK